MLKWINVMTEQINARYISKKLISRLDKVVKDFFHSPTIKVKKEKKRMFRRGGFQRGKVVDAQTVTYCRWHPFNPFNVGNINVCCLYRKSRPYKCFPQLVNQNHTMYLPERMWHKQVHILLCEMFLRALSYAVAVAIYKLLL